jgi:hypothetical protein
MTKKTNSKDMVVEVYKSIVLSSGFAPSQTDLMGSGVSVKMIAHNFVNMTKLHNHMRKNYPDLFKDVLDETVFTKKRFQKLKSRVRGSQRFIITTAVVEKKVHPEFYSSIKTYCKRNNTELLILPCQDIASRNRAFNWNLDGILKDDNIIYNDLKLNGNLFISSIKLSAKQINPLTGLSRIGQRHGSFVYASPKQSLEFVAESNKKKIPRALMTPGAITIPDYTTDSYMSSRTSYIAENDHVLGAVIVELDSGGIFHFRQIQANPVDGSFIDLHTCYMPNNKVTKVRPEALILGDWHSGSTDPVAKAAFKNLAKVVRPKNLILHDLFDGKSISHHNEGKPLVKAKNVMRNTHSLKSEILGVATDLNELLTWIDDSIIIVKSNHDEHLDRYLVEGRYVNDPQNHYDALKLAVDLLEGNDALKNSVSKNLNDPDRVYWLTRDDEYKIGGVECGAHGDLGSNGAKGSPQSLEKAYGNCVTGHAHTPCIFRGVFRMGTLSLMKLDYTKGPSSWVHTSCLIFENGERQLINVINGKWNSNV